MSSGIIRNCTTRKHNITSHTENKDQKVEVNIKFRKRYLTCIFLTISYNLRYNKLKTYLQKNYIMGINRYPQDLPEFIKQINNYIEENKNNTYFRKISV